MIRRTKKTKKNSKKNNRYETRKVKKGGVRPGKEPIKPILSLSERLSKLSEIKKPKPKRGSPLASSIVPHSGPYTIKRPSSINIALTKSPPRSPRSPRSPPISGLIDKLKNLTT